MSIVVENLYGLICIPFVILFLWWSIKKQKGTVLTKWVIISRIFLCSLLIGALCGLSFQMVGKNVATVFLLDVSDSMRDFREEGISFIQNALEDLPKHHKASVIVFGADNRMDKFLDTSKSYSKIGAAPITTATNIEQALQSALTYLPEEASKEIILLSDGQENEGDMLQVTELMKSAHVDFKVYKVGHEKQSEVYIDQVSVPEKIYKEESFSVITNVVSNVKTQAKLTLFSGTEKKSEQWVDLEVGENSFVFKDVQTTGGFKSYKVMIEAEEDYELGNNEYSCFTTVEDAPQILLIEGMPGEGIGIENVLKQMGGSYKVIPPQSAPISLEEMMAYKAMVLSNVFIDELPEGFIDHIEGYVKNYGGGLLVTGGEDAYALGGYEGTVLEKILPVDMHKKGQMAMPTVSLCLVIDHSGSMSEQMGGTNKLGLSIQAVTSVLDYLEEKDEISVFSFDDSYTKVVERQKVTDKDQIKSLIYGIREGGGTSIYPALEAAYKTQRESSADIKHIILLTDGQDSFSASQYSTLIDEINQDKITVSTVAVGDGANNQLLNHLAKEGGGRAYIADKKSNLPHIFAKEFFLSSGEYLMNETFEVQATSHHEVLQGIMDEGGFLLNGYIGTSMKPLATQVLTSHQAEPILALWQYGLGKTVAWTSDVNGQWSGPLFESSKGAKLFKNILSWSMTTYEGEGEVDLIDEGSGVRVKFTSDEIEANKKVVANYQSASGVSQEAELLEVAPGLFEAYIPLEENGFYAFNITESIGGESKGSYISAFAKQYSKEYKFTNQESGLMQLIEAVDGKLITRPNEVFKVESKRSYKTIELTNILLMLAFFWFLIDIIMRRFNLKLSWVTEFIVGLEKSSRVKSKVVKKQSESLDSRTSRSSRFSRDKEEKRENKGSKTKLKLKLDSKQKIPERILDTASLLKSKKDRHMDD